MAIPQSRKLPSANRPPPAPKNRPTPASNPNFLLAALCDADYSRLLPTLEVVSLKLKHVVHKAGERVQYVYFPGGGFFSILTVLEDGSMVEVATIGREGMIGVSAMLGSGPIPSLSMVQAESQICYRMHVDAFRREMDRRGDFYDLLTHYTQALVGFIMQSTACNAVHSVEQRLARWLLLAQDRVGQNEFPLTQEFVAMMLGATRPTVTVVAGTLQKARLIRYHRGRITIVNRKGLERASCECYRVITALMRAVPERARRPGPEPELPGTTVC